MSTVTPQELHPFHIADRFRRTLDTIIAYVDGLEGPTGFWKITSDGVEDLSG